MMRGRKPTIASHVHPAVRFMAEESRRQEIPRLVLAERAGVGDWQPHNWAAGGASPMLCGLEACLNVLGYRLAAVPLANPDDVETSR